MWSRITGDTSHVNEALTGLTEPVLKSLGIPPSETDMQAITEQMLRYSADARADFTKLKQVDFSTPSLAAKAPPLPARQVSWKDLVVAWRKSTGGVLEVDGIGVSRERERPYLVAIRELTQVIGNIYPKESFSRPSTSICQLASRRKRTSSTNNATSTGVHQQSAEDRD